MRAHRARSESIVNQAGASLPDDSFVFSMERMGERPLHPDSVSHAFNQLCKPLGIVGVRLHVGRVRA